MNETGSGYPEDELSVDTAEHDLHKPETCEQAFMDTLSEFCHTQAVQPKLLSQLKGDKHIVRQLFQSTYLDDLYVNLLDVYT